MSSNRALMKYYMVWLQCILIFLGMQLIWTGHVVAQLPPIKGGEIQWDKILDEDFELDEEDEYGGGFQDGFDEFSDSMDPEDLEMLEDQEFNPEEFGIESDGSTGGVNQEKDVYVDEGLVPTNTRGLLEAELFRRRALLAEERINAPFNIAYGIGTGLMIGGWFALLFANTSRDTLRSIGLGIVLGGIMGIVIGTRSLLNPTAPRPPMASTPYPPPPLKNPLMEESQRDYQLGLSFNF